MLIYILDMGMREHRNQILLLGMNNFIAYQMETFFFVFLVMPSKKCSSVCGSTVVTSKNAAVIDEMTQKEKPTNQMKSPNQYLNEKRQ